MPELRKRPLGTGQAPKLIEPGASIAERWAPGRRPVATGRADPPVAAAPARIAALCWRCQEAAGHLGSGNNCAGPQEGRVEGVWRAVLGPSDQTLFRAHRLAAAEGARDHLSNTPSPSVVAAARRGYPQSCSQSPPPVG